MTFPNGWVQSVELATNAQSIDLSGSVVSFPLLITQDTLNFPKQSVFTSAQTDGGDIRFTSDASGQNRLPLEIELFDTTTSACVFWVNLGASDLSSSPSLHMWWDVPTTEFQPDSSASYGQHETWGSDFVGVWHLNQSGTGVIDEFQDSTSALNHGSATGSQTPVRTTGIAGYGQLFDGVDDRIKTGDNLFPVSNDVSTIEGWSLLSSAYNISNETTIFGYGTDNDGNRRVLQQRSQGIGQQHSNSFIGSSNLRNGWTYLVGVIPTGATETSAVIIYVDGEEITDKSILAGSSQTINTILDKGPFIGRNTGPANAFTSGTMDEVRVSNVVRNSSWIKATYENVQTNFISAGDVVVRTNNITLPEITLEGIGVLFNNNLPENEIDRLLQQQQDIGNWAYDLAKRTLSKGECFDEDVINLSIENIIATLRGERVFNPNFGTILPLITFELLDYESAQDLVRILLRAIRMFERRITVIESDVMINILTEQNAFELTIPYRINRNELIHTFNKVVVL